MKTLFPKQKQSVDFLKSALLQYKGALDSSHTGVGKTVIACHLAKEMGLPVAVVCPKIVIPHWERELADVGIEPLFVLNYEKLKRGNDKNCPRLARSCFVGTCHRKRSLFGTRSTSAKRRSARTAKCL
jgi:hypothetical protein